MIHADLVRTNWNEHDWQLIHTAAQSPNLHMALDEVLTDEVSAGRRAPIAAIAASARTPGASQNEASVARASPLRRWYAARAITIAPVERP